MNKNQSLIDDYTYDYAIPKIVNILKEGQDGNITLASQLDDSQTRKVLLLYIAEVSKLRKKIQKAQDYLDKIL